MNDSNPNTKLGEKTHTSPPPFQVLPVYRAIIHVLFVELKSSKRIMV